jgi:hypothetical protein
MAPASPLYASRLHNVVRNWSAPRQPFCKYTRETVIEINQMHQEYLTQLQQIRSNLVVDFFRPMRLFFNGVTEGAQIDAGVQCQRVVGSSRQWEAVVFTLNQLARLTDIDYGMLAILDGPLSQQSFLFDPKAHDVQELFANNPAEAAAVLHLQQFEEVMGRFPGLTSAFGPPNAERVLGVMRGAFVGMQEFQQHCRSHGAPSVSLSNEDREAVRALQAASIDENAVPDMFRCPIGGNVMRMPVVLCGDGYTYDYKNLSDFVSRQDNWVQDTEHGGAEMKSPVTRQPLDGAGCVLNRGMLRHILALAKIKNT